MHRGSCHADVSAGIGFRVRPPIQFLSPRSGIHPHVWDLCFWGPCKDSTAHKKSAPTWRAPLTRIDQKPETKSPLHYFVSFSLCNLRPKTRRRNNPLLIHVLSDGIDCGAFLGSRKIQVLEVRFYGNWNIMRRSGLPLSQQRTAWHAINYFSGKMAEMIENEPNQ